MLIELTETYGFSAAIRGGRNPKNSWNKSDSKIEDNNFILGDADKKLAQQLVLAGTEHAKFLRFIVCWADVTAPLYWWKEFDTYKFVEKSSCSTMHKITSRHLQIDDFEIEYLDDEDIITLKRINELIDEYNSLPDDRAYNNKEFLFRKIIQKLPSSYLQKRTIVTNYAELRNMYHQRENHKLREWHKFCEWIETLPYAKELITIEKKKGELIIE